MSGWHYRRNRRRNGLCGDLRGLKISGSSYSRKFRDAVWGVASAADVQGPTTGGFRLAGTVRMNVLPGMGATMISVSCAKRLVRSGFSSVVRIVGKLMPAEILHLHIRSV